MPAWLAPRRRSRMADDHVAHERSRRVEDHIAGRCGPSLDHEELEHLNCDRQGRGEQHGSKPGYTLQVQESAQGHEQNDVRGGLKLVIPVVGFSSKGSPSELAPGMS